MASATTTAFSFLPLSLIPTSLSFSLLLLSHPTDVLKVRMQLQNAKSGGIRVGMVRALGLKKHSFFFNLVLVATKNHLDPNLSLSLVFSTRARPFFPILPSRSRIGARQRKKNKKHERQIKTATSLFSTEGPRAFYNGLGPALARGVFYGGTRLGLYSPLRDAISAAFDGRERGDENDSNRGGEASTSGRSGSGVSATAKPLQQQPSFGAGLAAGCLSGCAAAALTKCVFLKFRFCALCSLKIREKKLEKPHKKEYKKPSKT